MLETAIAGLLAILIYMTLIWGWSVRNQNAGIVDVFWGPGFLLVCLVYFVLPPDGFLPRKVLILALVAVWAVRLGLHLGLRNIGKQEDARYAQWRTEGGRWWWLHSYGKVFLLQGVIMWVIAMPLLLAESSAEPPYLTVFDYAGIAVWGVGFIFEAVGDWQLTRFKADPANKGRVLQTGLWKYTRHPNYFGDALCWWGYALIGLSVPFGFLGLLSAAAMTLLLMRVSGVPLLERRLVKTRPEYAAYTARTNAFFPGPPRPMPEREAELVERG
jgi:steroid 5-alpha reductase family enzyme